MSKSEIRKTNSGKFLLEYKLLQQVDSVPDDADEIPVGDRVKAASLESAIRPFDPLVADGDLRLFSQTEQITYGAILPWDEMRALVVPMSHYENPATGAEFYAEDAEKRGLFQKVFQVWNARTIQRSLLSKTWKIGTLSADELKRMKQMLRHVMLGEELPENLSGRTGICDPRLSNLISGYQQQEQENFGALDAEDARIESALEELPKFDFPACEFEQVMAASGRKYLSPVYVRRGKKWSYLDAVEAENFEPVKAGEELPLLCWFAEKLRAKCQWRVVAFRAVKNRALLGVGVIEPENGGFAIRLRYQVDAREIPALQTPADIEIVILES